MTVRELREKYLRFFESKGHKVVPSGSLIPYDVTGRLDESLLFNGAGMVQFKPYFRGTARPESPRVTNCQKCVRTGDIESVGDLTHLTFFEMLGNFSFGDYFKAQAIAFSWEFLTSPEWLGLEPNKLSFTIFEDDEEAFTEWSLWLRQAGIEPETRIIRLGEDTNYWPAGSLTSGPPGPCGPNSEMFYWVSEDPPPGAGYTRDDWLQDDAKGNWLEIWNDVFIQYDWQGRLRNPAKPQDGYEKDGMPALPFQSIDTGMGLDRTAAVLAGKKSVYETDAFEPIIRKIEDLRCRMGDKGEADRAQESGASEDPQAVATRIIADHIRTACFCIADGVLPGNSGRGYVLRRLIRRAVLKGQRVLGFEKPFFHEVFEGVRDAMGHHYHELNERSDTIVETLKSEESLFRRTLAAGSALLQAELGNMASRGVLSGETAFRLYDTYGFPLEVTREIAGEQGISIDEQGYELAMEEAQRRSRAGQERETVYGGLEDSGAELAVPDPPASTLFVGYECTQAEGRIVRAVLLSDGDAGSSSWLRVALDQTPFYAESGGQIGDHGMLMGDGFAIKVSTTTKSAGTFWHEGELERTDEMPVQAILGQTVTATVLSARRARIMRNHSATHLLHAALRQVLGTHVTQAGSYVGPDHLRFDFTHGKSLSKDELERVERIVNERVLENIPVSTYVDIPIDEARAKGAMALFGEKYGERVRMVEVGGFSRELCGGTHVRTTGEIGLFKITSESSAASGVRRIEAITGEAAYDWTLDQARHIRDAAERLKTSPKELVSAIERTLEQLRDETRRREKAEQSALRASVRSGGPDTPQGSGADFAEVGSTLVWAKNFGEVDQKIAASELDSAAGSKPNLVAVAAVAADGRVTFIAKAGPEAVNAGAHSGNLLREVAKIAGGGGGGRAEFATAGAKDASKIDEALAAVPGLLKDQLAAKGSR